MKASSEESTRHFVDLVGAEIAKGNQMWNFPWMSLSHVRNSICFLAQNKNPSIQ